MTPPYEPKGIRYQTCTGEERLMILEDGNHLNGWICYRHPDGQWVSLNRATDGDKLVIKQYIEKLDRDSEPRIFGNQP